MAAPARNPAPVFFGTVTEEGPYGPCEMPMGLPIQRRMSRKGVETWVIACPRCGGIHEHSAGEGATGLHCGPEVKERGDYYVCDASHLPIVPNDARADAWLRRRGWIGLRGGPRVRLRIVCTD